MPDGSLKFQGWQPHLSEALAGEAVGLVEVEEELWQIWFCDYKVAVLDAARPPSMPPCKLLRCQQSARSNRCNGSWPAAASDGAQR